MALGIKEYGGGLAGRGGNILTCGFFLCLGTSHSTPSPVSTVLENQIS